MSGVRVLQTNNETLQVINAGHWSSTMTALLQHDYPDVRVHADGSHVSATGLLVSIFVPRDPVRDGIDPKRFRVHREQQIRFMVYSLRMLLWTVLSLWVGCYIYTHTRETLVATFPQDMKEVALFYGNMENQNSTFFPLSGLASSVRNKAMYFPNQDVTSASSIERGEVAL